MSKGRVKELEDALEVCIDVLELCGDWGANDFQVCPPLEWGISKDDGWVERIDLKYKLEEVLGRDRKRINS